MFVGGGTRKGKSTLLTNFTSQVMQRDYGGLIITLGKDDDDEEFIAEWPANRPEEDFVFIDTGDDYEEMVRFNLLEVPTELEPGSVAHSSYVEALADDMSAAFAQTGGSDNYWGALMSRVTRTLIRGMTQSGKTCTPVDLAAACSSQDNLQQFADWMSDERIHFIRETAERIKEKEDSDLEPLAGRMDNVVHNATLRTLLSTREPTVRIQDIVDDGKIAILRLDPSLGETEKSFITTPLVRRFYNAKKIGESENDGSAEHWAPMADAYVPMTQLGFIFEIPEQTGDEMPDGSARVDDALELDGLDDPTAIADAVNTYRDENSVMNRLAGARDAYIESEHTTGSTQPSQTVTNLAQAHNEGHRCLFFCRDDVARGVYNTVAANPFCCRSSHDVDGERRFYTGTTTLSIGGEPITRPGGRENVWIHDETTDEYVLRDGEGTVHARFANPEQIFTDSSAYPEGGDRNIKPPVIPEHEFDGDHTDAEWDVIVVPADARTLLDLRLYEDAEQIPLPDLVEHDSTREAETGTAAVLDDGDDRKTDGSTKSDKDESSSPASVIEEAASYFD